MFAHDRRADAYFANSNIFKTKSPKPTLQNLPIIEFNVNW
jgi:hypothetical protein